MPTEKKKRSPDFGYASKNTLINNYLIDIEIFLTCTLKKLNFIKFYFD